MTCVPAVFTFFKTNASFNISCQHWQFISYVSFPVTCCVKLRTCWYLGAKPQLSYCEDMPANHKIKQWHS